MITEIVKTLTYIGRKHDRYTAFNDFVFFVFAALRNSLIKNKTIENEYFERIKKYSKDEMNSFKQSFHQLVDELEKKPADVLGEIAANLELTQKDKGQYFTPTSVSELIAAVNGDVIKTIGNKGFVTVGDPACGGGALLMAYVKIILDAGYNPAQTVWIEGRDIDCTAAMMCYIQLTLWNVPGRIVIGNTLANEFKEVHYTLAHHTNFWDMKLRWDRASVLPHKAEGSLLMQSKEVILPAQKVDEGLQMGFDF